MYQRVISDHNITRNDPIKYLVTRVGNITLDLHKLLSVSLKLTLTTAIHDWQQAPHISPVRARRGMCVVNSRTKIHQFCHCCDEIIYVLNWSAIFREPTICNHLKVSSRVGWVHCNKVPMATPSLCLCCMLYWATIHRESFPASLLTHWDRVTHICVGNLTIIGSDNDLSPGRRHAIAWTSVGILIIEPLGTKFSEMLIENHTFSFTKIYLEMSSIE